VEARVLESWETLRGLTQVLPWNPFSMGPDPKAKAISDIKKKAATFANYKCVECAEALKTILVAAGVKGSMVRLTNKPPNKQRWLCLLHQQEHEHLPVQFSRRY